MASKIKVDQLETADGSGTIALQNQLSGLTTASLPTVTTDKLGTGAVLQVVTGEQTSWVSMATQSWQNTGLSGTITPSSTSSKILITVSFGKAQTTQYHAANESRSSCYLTPTINDNERQQQHRRRRKRRRRQQNHLKSKTDTI